MEFHSSREERLSTAPKEVIKAYEKRKGGNFLKKNPQIKILIIDLVLVFLFGGVILPFLLKLTNKIEIENYKVDTKAFVFEDKLLVSLNFIPTKRKNSKNLATENIKVDILTEDKVIASETGSFPQTPETFYISFKLDDNENLDKIYINLTTLDYNKDYTIKVKR